jgi:hypothetical protein
MATEMRKQRSHCFGRVKACSRFNKAEVGCSPRMSPTVRTAMVMRVLGETVKVIV